ncbi:unnamed protein product [Paramecium sonneborni]|uniref:Uncharacterized protein n=1 Tax=Paramecium sonneborni TaxID=65129 RepID=A0A8S1QTE1_9CILI|nr:unnamed protein product [Paramecium sonneborni]
MASKNPLDQKSQIIDNKKTPISIASSDDCIELRPQEYKGYKFNIQ